MCIRDSNGIYALSRKQDVNTPTAIMNLSKILRYMLYETSPVSYTHLRAHETVLDLVCRLLLEKKHLHNSYYTPALDMRTMYIRKTLCSLTIPQKYSYF